MAAGFLPVVHFLTLDCCDLRRLGAGDLADRPAAAIAARGVRRGSGHRRGHRPRLSRDAADALLGYVLGATCVINGAWYVAMFLGVPLAIEHWGCAGLGGPG